MLIPRFLWWTAVVMIVVLMVGLVRMEQQNDALLDITLAQHAEIDYLKKTNTRMEKLTAELNNRVGLELEKSYEQEEEK